MDEPNHAHSSGVRAGAPEGLVHGGVRGAGGRGPNPYRALFEELSIINDRTSASL